MKEVIEKLDAIEASQSEKVAAVEAKAAEIVETAKAEIGEKIAAERYAFPQNSTGTVITPVFKFAQTFEQHRNDVFTSNCNDYAAHGTTPKS